MNAHTHAAQLRRGLVCLADASPVECWLRDGERWNGFAIPYFDAEQLREVLAMLREELGCRVRFEDGVVTVNEPEDSPFEQQEERVERGPTGLWCVGGWCWTWEDVP